MVRLPSTLVNPEMELDSVPDRYLPSLRADADRVVALTGTALDTSGLDTSVPDCPGWDVRTLVTHLGAVHRWAATAIATGAPGRLEVPDVDDAALADWFAQGADLVLAALAAADPAAPTWHPFDDHQVMAVWFRRQAHETAMHRRDLEVALHGSTGCAVTPLPPELASDGIDELLDIGWSRAIARSGAALPSGTLHLHCTDVAGEWLVWDDGGRLGLRREHAKGDAAIRGRAEAILLHLVHRAGRDPELAIDVVGDAAVADTWLALPTP